LNVSDRRDLTTGAPTVSELRARRRDRDLPATSPSSIRLRPASSRSTLGATSSSTPRRSTGLRAGRSSTTGRCSR
jgi:hypothetical protein